MFRIAMVVVKLYVEKIKTLNLAAPGAPPPPPPPPGPPPPPPPPGTTTKTPPQDFQKKPMTAKHKAFLEKLK